MFKKLLKTGITSLLLCAGAAQAQTHYSIARLGTGATGNFTENDKFNYPNAVVADANGKIFIADTDNNRIQVWTQSGNNFGYKQTIGDFGNLNGLFRKPSGIAFYQDKMYVADTKNNRVQVFTQSGDNFGFYAYIAGTPNIGGYRDQPGQLNTELFEPKSVAVSSNGTIYIADTQNHRVQVWTQSGSNFGYVATLGTTSVNSGDNDKFFSPSSISLDASGKIYIADAGNSRVQVWTQSGANFGYYATIGTTNVLGSANNVFSGPNGVSVASDNKVYIADVNNNRIQVFTQSGNAFGYYATIGKNGNGPDDLFYPTGVFVSANNKVYVAENFGQRINIFDVCTTTTQIVTQPKNSIVCPGGQGYFTVSATGFGTLAYAWSNGESTIESMQTDVIANNYNVTVSGRCGVVVSTTVSNVAGIETNWVTQPVSSQEICQGKTATISVSAVGTNLRYSWSSGITATTPIVTVSGDGTYNAYAEGDCFNKNFGSYKINSNQSSLVVRQDVTIFTAPESKNILPNTTTGLSVAAFGYNISYLWSNGATTTGISNIGAGTYTVSVSGFCGVKTATAIVSVNTFVGAKVVFTSTGVQTFTGTKAKIDWPKLSNALTYCIRFIKILPFTPTVANICGLDREEYLFVLSASGLRTQAGNETIYYQVAGVDAAGNQSEWSDTQTFVLRTDGITSSVNGKLLIVNDKFSIYPNPTNGEFIVLSQLSTTNSELLTIFNAQGSVVYSQKIVSENTPINANLIKGIYLVKVGKATSKLVIE